MLAALFFYGSRSLYGFLHWSWAQDNLIGGKIPIVNLPLNLSLIFSVAVFVLLMAAVTWFINQNKLGSLLIETETEMKKVTWPSWNESFNSSIIVLVAVIFFMIFLGFADIVFNKIFKIIFHGFA